MPKSLILQDLLYFQRPEKGQKISEFVNFCCNVSASKYISIKSQNKGSWRKLIIGKFPPSAHCAQWAETALLRKFGHNFGKKRDTGAVKGLFEAY